MPWFPNPSGGAPIQADTNPNPAGGSYGVYSDPGYNGPPPAGGSSPSSPSPSPSPSSPPTVTGNPQQLAAGINSLLGAIASGNKQAFDEAVRQFNVTFGLDQDKFQESIRQFNQNYLISQSGVTGTYNGQQTQQAALQAANIAAQQAGLTGYYVAPGMGGAGPGGAASPLAGYPPGTVVRTANNQFGVVGPGGTLDTNPNNPAIGAAIQAGQGVMTVPDPAFAAGQQAAAAGGGAPGAQGQMTTAYQQQLYAQQMGVINAAAQLQANPFRQAQVMGQAGRVLAGLPTAGFGAPNTVPGVGTQGGNMQGGLGYLQQMIGDINAGGYQQQQPAPGGPAQLQPMGAVSGGQLQTGQYNPSTGGMTPEQIAAWRQQMAAGPAGGMGNLSQLISDIKSPTPNTSSPQDFLNATPTPNKIDSAGFLRSAPSTQNLILQAMQERYGIDPQDSLKQIQNTLPQFNAPNTTGVVRRG